MRIVVSQRIVTDPEVLEGLIIEAFREVDTTGVELHLERARPRAPTFVGRAYPQLPSRPRTHAGTRFLVRLMLPSVLRNRGYPVTYRYRGLSTAPWITVSDWRERLVALAAHEAFHIHQFREGLRRSEVQAERWAVRILTSWRELRTAPTQPIRAAEPARIEPEQLQLPGVA